MSTQPDLFSNAPEPVKTISQRAAAAARAGAVEAVRAALQDEPEDLSALAIRSGIRSIAAILQILENEGEIFRPLWDRRLICRARWWCATGPYGDEPLAVLNGGGQRTAPRKPSLTVLRGGAE